MERLSAVEAVRQRLLAGEELSQVDVEKGNVRVAAQQLERTGHRVLARKEITHRAPERPITRVYYRVAQPAQPAQPDEGDEGDGSEAAPALRAAPLGSMADVVRRRFLDGEALTAEQLALEYGVPRSYLTNFLQREKQRGWAFGRTSKKDPDGKWRSHYRLLWAPAQSKGELEESVRVQEEVPPPVPPVPAQPESPAAGFPALGMTVRITLLAFSDDEQFLNVGLRNGNRSWMAQIPLTPTRE